MNRQIFIHSLVLSSLVALTTSFCLYVLLTGIMVGLVKFALVDGFQHHLHMTEKLHRSSLVEIVTVRCMFSETLILGCSLDYQWYPSQESRQWVA